MKEKEKIIKKLDLMLKYFIMFASTKNVEHYQRQNIITYLEDFLERFHYMQDKASSYFDDSEMVFLDLIEKEMNDVVFYYAYKDYDVSLNHKDEIISLYFNTFKEKTLKEIEQTEYIQDYYQPEYFSYHLDGYKNDNLLTLEGAMFTYVDRDEKESLEKVRDFLIENSDDFDNVDFEPLNKFNKDNLAPKNRVTLKHINADLITFFKPGHFRLINPGYVKIKVKEQIILKNGIPKRDRKISFYKEQFEYLEYNDTMMKIDDETFYAKDNRADAIRNLFNECISMLEEQSEVRKKL